MKLNSREILLDCPKLQVAKLQVATTIQFILIPSILGADNILNINYQRGVHYVPYQTSAHSWLNQKRYLYTTNKGAMVTTKSCKMAHINKIEVFNYEKWQVWETKNQFRIGINKDDALSIIVRTIFQYLRVLKFFFSGRNFHGLVRFISNAKKLNYCKNLNFSRF